jgi:hypothetical protein
MIIHVLLRGLSIAFFIIATIYLAFEGFGAEFFGNLMIAIYWLLFALLWTLEDVVKK